MAPQAVATEVVGAMEATVAVTMATAVATVAAVVDRTEATEDLTEERRREVLVVLEGRDSPTTVLSGRSTIEVWAW